MNRSVLITGVSGYLGSHVAKTFKQNGWTVHGFDNNHSTNNYIDVMRTGDITNPVLVDILFNSFKFDLVVHLAARIEAGISVKEPWSFYHTNTGGTANIVRAMKENGINNIIFSSTAAVYQTKDDKIKESDPIEFNSPYGHSKQMAEDIIVRSGVNHVIFRFFNLTGADSEGEFGEEHEPETHLIPRLILNQDNGDFVINGNDYPTKDGTNVRDYVHVTDVAEAIHTASIHLENKGESDIFNLGSGTGHGITEIIKELEKQSQKKVKYEIGPRRAGDAVSLVADITKAEKILNYAPKYDIFSIIKTAYRWHTDDKKTKV